ncbi:MAG: RNase J family beta-CASP ribonuclease [Candidatus Nanoarchaeia archaeon]|nr:RNase J family beta-CASP ribonuclease [Candidatus Nanoarchaeia archaeon]MDD5054225.1 RNase J family beta-CASP ribonuclease [Candidatus Nanoarchaeia archaeon]MDD5499278.1 RNase J family beta-CASP ribonuclease [Candidatus Nanoarchaeia archaeon]
MIEIYAVGGYSGIGKNMTALKYENETIILDMGLDVSKLMDYEGESSDLSNDKLRELEVLPNDREVLKKLGHTVKAIICSHAHLDHLGAIPKISNNYSAPIIITPFSFEVLKNLEKNQKQRIKNRIIKLNPGKSIQLSKNLRVEFIYATHSTLQTVMIAIHTPKGAIVYSNDFKFDDSPTYGQKTNYEHLKKIGRQGVIALIDDCTRIDNPGRTFSESIVKEMIKDLLLNLKSEKKLVVLTTFASHCIRINNIIEISKKMGRTPIIMGRSMKNYLQASTNARLIDFSKAKIASFNNEVADVFMKIRKNGKDKYLLVMTGNQGEPNSMLSRISKDELPLRLEKEDLVVFCSETIPTPECMKNRAEIEKNLRKKGVRVYTDYHASGHASREDHRDLISMLKPKYFIPSHGTPEKIRSGAELAKEEGYKSENIKILKNGEKAELKI